jgi:hypothetical protein
VALSDGEILKEARGTVKENRCQEFFASEKSKRPPNSGLFNFI